MPNTEQGLGTLACLTLVLEVLRCKIILKSNKVKQKNVQVSNPAIQLQGIDLSK